MIVHEDMHEVRIDGWSPGAKKVSGTKAIQDQTSLGLKDSKMIIDRSLEGIESVISFETKEPAIKLAKELDALGFEAKAYNSSTEQLVWPN